MLRLKSVKIAVLVEIDPEFLSDPERAIKRKISSHILRYSHKIEGVPLAFTIRGVTPTGSISCDTGGVTITALVEYIVLKISLGDAMKSVAGMVLGVFYVEVDGNEEHSGEFVVKGIASRGSSSFTILGSRA